ncbi:MAG: adenylate kinase [Eubacterium sp.]
MIILIAGATHTGKTRLAQRLLEKYKYPYLSIDHLKMGLIRSGNTDLTPEDDEKLTPYLWCIVKEMIKTAIENNQNLIVEGCYIPFNWEKDFDDEYLNHIQYYCLVMTKEYIEKHFDDIKQFANVIENRGDDCDCIKENILRDNIYNLEMCKKHGSQYILIYDDYESELSATF